MGHPKVTIIILNWNGKAITADCLQSLVAVTYENYEIMLVDNGSEDGSAEYFRSRYPSIELICNDRNLGFAEGNNVGIRLALGRSADYVLLLNNDTVVDSGFLRELVSAAERDPKVAFAGPKTYFYDYRGKKDVIAFAGGLIDFRRGKSVHIGEKQVDTGQYNVPREVDYVEGSCMLARASALKKIGLLDPAYFLYWEEIDLCVRGKMAGYRSSYVPGAIIWHKVGASSQGYGNIYFMTRNRFWFMKRYADKKQYRSFLLYFFGYDLWETARFFLFRGRFSRLADLFKGVMDGLKGIKR